MKQPPSFTPARPASGTRRVPRSRTEAAIELVRTEFERARLTRDIAQLSSRARTSSDALTRYEARADLLLRRLTATEETPG